MKRTKWVLLLSRHTACRLPCKRLHFWICPWMTVYLKVKVYILGSLLQTSWGTNGLHKWFLSSSTPHFPKMSSYLFWIQGCNLKHWIKFIEVNDSGLSPTEVRITYFWVTQRRIGPHAFMEGLCYLSVQCVVPGCLKCFAHSFH